MKCTVRPVTDVRKRTLQVGAPCGLGGLPLKAYMEPFFSCRNASKGRPLQASASASTDRSGPRAVEGGGEAAMDSATVLKVSGWAVASGTVVPASVTPSASSKVSPRLAEGGRESFKWVTSRCFGKNYWFIKARNFIKTQSLLLYRLFLGQMVSKSQQQLP